MKWWEVAWNPTIGCTPEDETCRRCWAKLLYERLHPGQSFNHVQLCPHVMDKPLRRLIKTTYFVCNLSDLFHKDVPDDYIHECFAVMQIACWHNFLVLTKRVDRAVKLLTAPDAYERRLHAVNVVRDRTGIGVNVGVSNPVTMPAKNIAFGATVGLQKHADERIPLLLQVPAWRHFVSYEPALGPVVFKPEWMDSTTRVDWIVAGGENDEDADDCHLDWLRSVIKQCDEHQVALMIKQLGSRPVDSQCAVWPRDSSVSLQGTGFGQYRVTGLRNRAWGNPEEWPTELRRHQELVFGYPHIKSSDVERSRKKGKQRKDSKEASVPAEK